MISQSLQLRILIKTALFCIVLIFTSLGDAEAKKSDKCSALNQKPCPVIYPGPICDPGLGNIGGRCNPCGGNGQVACPAMEQGKQCRGSLLKIDGKCYAGCGGVNQKACPKIYFGYPCKGNYEPDSQGYCRPCGALNQKACRALKSGEQCKTNLTKDRNGICKPCGGQNERACPVLKGGTVCKAGLGKFNGVCQPCGQLNQRACPAVEVGRQCAIWTTERDGYCKPCGTPGTGACKVTDKGKACKDEYDWEFGKCAETVRSITRQKGLKKLEELGAEMIFGTATFASDLERDEDLKNSIQSGETPDDMPDNNLCAGDEHRAWTLGVAGEAGIVVGVEGEVGAAFRCANRAGRSDTKWYSSGAWTAGATASAGAGVNVGMWMNDYNNLRGEAHGIVIGLWDIASVVPAFAALNKVKYKNVISPDVSVGVWFNADEDGGVGEYAGFTISGGAAAGYGFIKYVNATTVQFCDYEMDCALHNWQQVHDAGDNKGDFISDGVLINVTARDEDGITVDITKNGQTRSNLYFDRHTITDKRDYELLDADDETEERICFRRNFKELMYLDGDGNCDRGITLKVTTRDPVNPDADQALHSRQIVGTPPSPPASQAFSSINTLGLWDMNVNGRTLTDEFVAQTDQYVILKRTGTTLLRRFEKVGENEYRNANGSTLRFVNSQRGIWISADKKTVYQLKKR